jgi:AcrR family transcriptional regulator
MPGNFKKEDLRIIKTRKALFSALSSLLERYHFTKITVYDICTEALVSRSAFYTHFKDKYDLLEKWLEEIRSRFFNALQSGWDIAERVVCAAFQTHIKLIENLISDADSEQRRLLLNFFTLKLESSGDEPLSDFFAGGIFNLLYVQVCERRKLSEDAIKPAISCARRVMQMLLEERRRR